MMASRNALRETVARIVKETPIVDMHTHIYPSQFGPLLLWGIDELLTYHYLVAEAMRAAPMPYADFWKMSKPAMADYIWEKLFIKRSPVSEACRGILTSLQVLGLDPGERDLGKIRKYFQEQNADEYIETVFERSNVRYAVMTNDPFDSAEREVWNRGVKDHPRFKAVLRVDPVLMNWEAASALLREQNYEVTSTFKDSSLPIVKKFLNDWIEKMNPLYMAVSLTPDFEYPNLSSQTKALSSQTKVIEHCILPLAREHNIPFAMMVGVKRSINPHLQLAGDGVGKADLSSLENLLLKYPDNRFFVTMLSRENQHELCVLARKFPNLMVFGCWWFMNNPSIIEEMTRERTELLGLSYIPQHSDARVLDQLLYKWTHSRKIIANVLADKYEDLWDTGWTVSEDEIQRDVDLLFSKNFETFLQG